VAKLISARESLGMQRQVFFVGMGGFDSHDDQNQDQPALFNMLTNSLKSFYDALVEVGANNDVTTFTASEFGRTLTSNGDGTDHGWGSHQIVMGDPTTSVEQYVESMLRWYGLSNSEIATVLPNLSSFNANAVNLML